MFNCAIMIDIFMHELQSNLLPWGFIKSGDYKSKSACANRSPVLVELAELNLGSISVFKSNSIDAGDFEFTYAFAWLASPAWLCQIQTGWTRLYSWCSSHLRSSSSRSHSIWGAHKLSLFYRIYAEIAKLCMQDRQWFWTRIITTTLLYHREGLSQSLHYFKQFLDEDKIIFA